MATCSVHTAARMPEADLLRTGNRDTTSGRWGLWPYLLAAALLLGAGFRLVWPGAIEYKEDEVLLYRQAWSYGTRGQWADLGLPSSQNIRVPAMGTWVFYPFTYLFGVAEPTAVARAVQVSSAAALVLLVLFAWRIVPPTEREPWLWAAALIAVNPIAILYQRKIWQPSMLPIFCVLFLMAWWHRNRRWGALVWGIVGAFLGQIHSSGFLYAAGIWFATVLADRRRVQWRYWLMGSVLGTLPMARWLYYLAFERDPVHNNFTAFHRWVEGKFWGHWISDAMGLDLRGFLGDDHALFLRWPLVGGYPTYGAGILQFLAAALGLSILVIAVVRWQRDRGTTAPRPALSSSALIVRAGFWCFGLLLTLAAVRFYRHYLLITFPLTALWLARLALPEGTVGRRSIFGRRLLLGLCVVNALCSAILLSYLHSQEGAMGGNFGMTYEAQVRHADERPLPSPSGD